MKCIKGGEMFKNIIATGFFTVIITAMLLGHTEELFKQPFQYECQKGKFFESATPNSFVFVKTNKDCFDSRNEPLIKGVKNANKH